jgi:hypothetical protein
METTTLANIRTALAQLVVRIVPRHQAHRAVRWCWQDDQRSHVAGPLRTFDLVPSIAEEVPGGAYGEGILYRSAFQLVATYDRWTDIEVTLAASDDGADLAAMLVRAHTTIAGMMPLEMEASARGEPLLLPLVDPESPEGRRVVRWLFVVKFWASDVVELTP